MNSSTTQSEPIKVGPGGVERPNNIQYYPEIVGPKMGPGGVQRPNNIQNYSIMSFLYFVIMLFALYLSFLCNNGVVF